MLNNIQHRRYGQRRNLGISFGKPVYVCKINTDNNTVVLGEKQKLYSKEAEVTEFNWISGIAPDKEIRCKVKVRYRQQEQWAAALPLENGNVRLVFDEAQCAVTPGQAAVLYDGDIVLGGGVII